MDEQVKVGDVIRLKSGGHKMVVSSVSEDGKYIKCVWHTDTGAPAEHVFPAEVLTGARSAEVKRAGDGIDLDQAAYWIARRERRALPSLLILATVAAGLMALPFSLLFSEVPRQYNEGWNAYHGLNAVSGGDLLP